MKRLLEWLGDIIGVVALFGSIYLLLIIGYALGY